MGPDVIDKSPFIDYYERMEKEQKDIKKDLKKTIIILVIIIIILVVLYLIDTRTNFLLKLTDSIIK